MQRKRRHPRNRLGGGCPAGSADDLPRRQLGWYLRNCALAPAMARLEGILLAHLPRLAAQEAEEEWPDDIDEPAAGLSRTERRRRLRALHRLLRTYAEPPHSEDVAERNALFAREEFGLDATDADILLLVVRYERNGELERLADQVLTQLGSPGQAVAALLGVDPGEAARRIAGGGALVAGGVLSLNEETPVGLAGPSGHLQLAPPLRRVMQRCLATREEWAAAVTGQPLATALGWEDFEHLGAVRELAARVVAGAAGASARGINLLLHGGVGTGKTEFAKALAARVGMSIWSVGEADSEGGEPSRNERLAAVRLAQRLLARRRDALILFDEAEDLLAPGAASFDPFRFGAGAGSRVYVHRTLEQNPVPVLWTCNYVDAIDAAVLRRMTLAVEVRTPSRPVRARIWRRVLGEAGLALGEDAVRRLATRYAAAPALAASAARAAALACGGEAEIEQAMAGVLRIMGDGPRSAEAESGDFDPALVNCRADLAGLAERLSRPGASQRWSLCLHGAPGTGKSQFARHLAQRLGLEVMQQRASDLLSCWVGDSEKRIAAAFQEARDDGALLLFDEADSLLSDRRGAAMSWEVTQVNEMLTWMESHPLPFICTTNLMERIDAASLRRFTLKLRLDPLTPAQAGLAFVRFFGRAAPRPLPDGLTPGDFATVRRRRDLFGAAPAGTLADWLEEEAEAKGVRAQSLGFVAGRG